MESLELFIQSRPEKTLSNGYNSRWNGSRTPLNYTFLNNRFPVNTVDTVGTITILTPLTNELGTAVTFLDTRVTLNIDSIGFYISIDGTSTSLDGGIYKIINIDPGTTNTVVIGASFTGSLVGGATGQRYYKGYKALANVYVGSPSYHPYNIDGSKPEYLAGTLEIDFYQDPNNFNINLGIGNVRNFIKPDITSEFDTIEENSHNLWTSFYIEYAEIWEGNETPTYTRDVLNGCTPFTDFVDSSFASGLGSWSTRSSSLFTESWSGNSGLVEVSMPNGNIIRSQVLFQSKQYPANSLYRFDLDIGFSDTQNLTILIVNDSDNVIASKTISTSGNTSIEFYTTKLEADIGVSITGLVSSETVDLLDFNVTANQGVSSPCDYSSFAVFGTKQFQDALGGNFGDYVLNVVDSDVTPKILTHFDKLSLYPNRVFEAGGGLVTIYSEFNNYINAIIPANVFTLSDGGDSVFLQFSTFENDGTALDVVDLKIDNKSDGVYTVDAYLGVNLQSFDYGYCQFVITPGNTLIDADYGTFNEPNQALWNISKVTGSFVNDGGFQQNSVIVKSGSGSGSFSISNLSSSTTLPTGETELYKFDSPISTIIGRPYSLVAYYYNNQNFSVENGKTSIYFKIEGTSIVSNKISLNSSLVDNEWIPLTIDFTATSSSVNIVLCIESIEDISFITATLLIDDITFKGPIEYVSEQKPIKINTDCFGYKGNNIRWLNDLGGWETWKFKQFQTVKEKFKKTEIKRDIFSDFDNYFINGSTQYDAIAVDSRKSITLRSGLLTDNELEVLSQLQRSIKVQILTDKETTFGSGTRKETYQTVSIKSGSFVLIEEEKNMHEISFDVTLPDTLTQEL